MIVGVLSSIVSAALLTGLSLTWRHRDHLALLRTTLYPRGSVRVSFATLLRVKDDDAYIVTQLTSRPGFYGPPGGVFKYFESATGVLDELGFRDERHESRRTKMRGDLRGFLPARSVSRFVRWFVAEVDRETAAECLRRELAEELEADGGRSLTTGLRGVAFTRVRVVLEGPHKVPQRAYRELRRFEIYDLATDVASARLRRLLLALSKDPAATSVQSVTGAEIASGWCGSTPIGPHTAYLLGSRKLLPDLPPVQLWAQT
jgi:8-oxo-dGTP pyrophosphatase MutT (NUDIX family)